MEHRSWSVYYDTRYYPERMPSAEAADRLLIWRADKEQLAFALELRGMCAQCAERGAERILALRPFVLIAVMVALHSGRDERSWEDFELERVAA